ncbi:MAG: SufD family Fe-S cluster assembly protein [Myxococcales bacterium]|nr:SufD family Fe-S cluster assembly protein [Myxococcales bacterium]
MPARTSASGKLGSSLRARASSSLGRPRSEQPGAQKTNARQTNNNLLLSQQAHVDTKPELLIYADDVKCAHGATVGELDELSLFYLRARGIPDDIARGLLLLGFLREVVDKVPNQVVQETLHHQLAHHLPGASNWLED